jgi:hypothetical protein
MYRVRIASIALGAILMGAAAGKGLAPHEKAEMHLTVATGGALNPVLELVALSMLVAIEFSVGAFLMLGIFRRATAAFSILLVAMMMVAVFRAPLTDCGCFGDAIAIDRGLHHSIVVVSALLTVLLLVESERYPR